MKLEEYRQIKYLEKAKIEDLFEEKKYKVQFLYKITSIIKGSNQIGKLLTSQKRERLMER